MTRWTMRVGCALLVLGAVANADVAKKDAPAKTSKGKPTAVFLSASDIQWGDAPPDLPSGAQLAVLTGDPTKAGAFTLRLKMPDGYKIPPHWHSQAESLTVLSGTLRLYMEDSMAGVAHDMDTGSFHSLPGKMHHAAMAKGEVIVQLHGNGPFDIHYLDPADNPNPKQAKR